MGLFDWLVGKRETTEEVPPKGSKPFRISYKFNPLRLKAHRDSKVVMAVEVKNTSGSRQLVSVDVGFPKGYKAGFDVSSSQKRHEARLGEMKAGETKTFAISIYGSPMTKTGEIPMEITAYAHYLNYNKVLVQSKKSAMLRVI